MVAVGGIGLIVLRDGMVVTDPWSAGGPGASVATEPFTASLDVIPGLVGTSVKVPASPAGSPSAPDAFIQRRPFSRRFRPARLPVRYEAALPTALHIRHEEAHVVLVVHRRENSSAYPTAASKLGASITWS
jgi:hypothetical protein